MTISPALRSTTCQRPVRGRFAAGLVALCSLLAATAPGWSPFAAPALAQVPADNVFAGFQPTGDFVVEIDGKDWPRAEVYELKRPLAFLVLAGALPAPLLVDVASRQVSALDLMKVAKKADGTVDLLADATLAPQGTFELVGQGEEVILRALGRTVRLKQRPWLLGAHTGQELLDHDPGYVRRAAAFKPDAAVIQKLKGQRSDVAVKVFFGSWCPHCKEHVPFLLRTAQELAGAGPRFDYYGLPRPFQGEPEAAKWGVSGVPTAIVLVGGKEVGRLPTTGWEHPETAILNVLTAAAPSGGEARK